MPREEEFAPYQDTDRQDDGLDGDQPGAAEGPEETE